MRRSQDPGARRLARRKVNLFLLAKLCTGVLFVPILKMEEHEGSLPIPPQSGGHSPH